MKRFLFTTRAIVSVVAICLAPLLAVFPATNAAASDVHVRTPETGEWTSQTVPNPSGDSGLNGVACLPGRVSPFCMAVGSKALPSKTLAETLKASKWSVSDTFNAPEAEYDGLDGVDCLSDKDCIAVGYSQSGTDVAALVERWNGTSWSAMTTPRPSKSSDYSLTGISCSSSVECIAVGSSVPSSNTLASNAPAESWNGSSWSLTKVPVAGIDRNSDKVALTSVSCVSATKPKTSDRGMCMAVGADQTQSSSSVTLLEQWNGKTWTETSPAESSAPDTIRGISCATKTQCLAVGYNPQSYLTAEVWNGTTWSLESPTTDPDSTSPSLDVASCPAVNECMAAGVGMLGGSETQSFSDFWDGGTWSLQTIPGSTESGTTQTMAGLSCTAETTCYAVGSAQNGSSTPVVYEYSG
jgi:hypothetical protein